jgi:hypothetical protein
MADINPDFKYVSQSREKLGGLFKENNGLGNAYTKENDSGKLNFNTTENTKSYNKTLADSNKQTSKGNEDMKLYSSDMDKQLNTPKDVKGDAKQGWTKETDKQSPQSIEKAAPKDSRNSTSPEQKEAKVNEHGKGSVETIQPAKTENDKSKSKFMDWFVGKVSEEVSQDNDSSPNHKQRESNTEINDVTQSNKTFETENTKQGKPNQLPPNQVKPDTPNIDPSFYDRQTPDSPPPAPEPRFPTISTRGPMASNKMPQFGGMKPPKASMPSFKFGK